jgi:Sec-independent protein translocase protein TatA
MLSFSPIKLGIVVVVALVLLGPDKIPHAARKASETLRAIQQFREKLERELRETVPDLPSTSEIARMARSPVRMLDRLSQMPSAAVAQAKRDLGAPSMPVAAPMAGEKPVADPNVVVPNPRFFLQPEGPAEGPAGSGPVLDPGAPAAGSAAPAPATAPAPAPARAAAPAPAPAPATAPASSPSAASTGWATTEWARAVPDVPQPVPDAPPAVPAIYANPEMN